MDVWDPKPEAKPPSTSRMLATIAVWVIVTALAIGVAVMILILVWNATHQPVEVPVR